MQPYQHFTLKERESLAEKLREGKSFREIARELNRSPSTISREVKRNWSKKKHRYHPVRATICYIIRRKKCVRKPRLADERTRAFVIKGLENYWSPEVISQRWRMEHPGIPLSQGTIYRALKSKQLKGFCAKTHLRRRGKRKNNRNTQTIHPVNTIHSRPEIVTLRKRLGDLEGDTVYGAIGCGYAVTLVDRTSRMLYAAVSKSRDSGLIAEVFEEALNGESVKTITLDRGSEFAKFPEIEKALGATIYFCDPHSPWQRPSNENTNGLLRFFFPKGTDFNAVDPDYFQLVVNLINNRPRKCLGWLSPVEFLRDFCCT